MVKFGKRKNIAKLKKREKELCAEIAKREKAMGYAFPIEKQLCQTVPDYETGYLTCSHCEKKSETGSMFNFEGFLYHWECVPCSLFLKAQLRLGQNKNGEFYYHINCNDCHDLKV